MNQASVSAAVDALERLAQGSTSATCTADVEAVNSILSKLSEASLRSEWAVHVDGEPMWCEDEEKALSLLRYCLARSPEGGAHLLRRDYVLGVWTKVDADPRKRESDV